MADTETPLEVPTPKQTFNMEDFGRIIGDAVAAGIAKNTPKKVTFGQFIARPTKLHPQGTKGPQLTRTCSMNGFTVDYNTTSDTDIDLLNRITHSGRYIDRKVEVIVNTDSAEETVMIRWACRTPDQRFEVGALAKDSTDLLQQIVAAQEVEDAAAASRVDSKAAKTHIGSAKARAVQAKVEEPIETGGVF